MMMLILYREQGSIDMELPMCQVVQVCGNFIVLYCAYLSCLLCIVLCKLMMFYCMCFNYVVQVFYSCIYFKPIS